MPDLLNPGGASPGDRLDPAASQRIQRQNADLVLDGGQFRAVVGVNNLGRSTSQSLSPLFYGFATSSTAGAGIFLGDELGLFKFRAGDPSGNNLLWDGTNLTITGSITATAGAIGGWTLSANDLSSGSAGSQISLNSTNQQILVGAATDATTGTGIFIGLDTTYQFRIGNPAGSHIKWSGSVLSIAGAITSSAMAISGDMSLTGDFTLVGSLLGTDSNGVIRMRSGANQTATLTLDDSADAGTGIDIVWDGSGPDVASFKVSNATVWSVAESTTTVDFAGGLTIAGSAVFGHTLLISAANIVGGPETQVIGTSQSTSAVLISRHTGDASPATLNFYKSRNTTPGSFTAVTTGDDIAQILVFADDGTDADTVSSAIVFDTEGTISTGQVPGVIRLQVAAAGTLANAMTILSTGFIGIGTASPGRWLEIEGDLGSNGTEDVARFKAGSSTSSGGLTVSVDLAASASARIVGLQSIDNQAQVAPLALNAAGGAVTVGSTLAITGNVGIGQAVGTSRLVVSEPDSGNFIAIFTQSHASSASGVTIDYSAATPNNTLNLFLHCTDASAVRLNIKSNGGIANFQSNDSDLSDRSTKNFFGRVSSSWTGIAALEIERFRYKDGPNSRMMIGVTAQNVQSVFPDSVESFDGDLLGVNNKDMLFHTIRTIQEVMQRIEDLEEKISSLPTGLV